MTRHNGRSSRVAPLMAPFFAVFVGGTALATPLPGDACFASDHHCFEIGGPGCTDPLCCPQVCALDPFCCDVSWDQICVNAAVSSCVPPPGCTPICHGVVEVEPCGADANGGCNMPVPQFESITCGSSVCGQAWANNGTRDTDWYALTLLAPATVTLSVTSAPTVVIGFLNTNDCDTVNALEPFAVAPTCGTATVSHCVQAGTWWIFVAPDGFSGYPCGTLNDYVLTVDCGAGCGELFCGDGICTGGETAQTCPQDCDLASRCGSGGPCSVAHEGVGCDDLLCCSGVCLLDPFCCLVQWDGVCAESTLTICVDPVSCPQLCPGDVGGDGIVNGADLGLLLGSWQTNSACSDLNGDGIVTGADLGLLLGAWGGCPVIVSPPSMGFGQARIGDVNIEAVNIRNPSPIATEILAIWSTSPSFTVIDPAIGALPGGDSAPLIVQFSPVSTGTLDAEIMVQLSNGQLIGVDVSGEGIPDQDSPFDQWLDLEVNLVAVAIDDALQLNYHYSLDLKPRGPVSVLQQPSTVEFLPLDSPPGALVELPVPIVPFGAFGPFPLQVVGPLGGFGEGARINLMVIVRDPFGWVLGSFVVNIPLVPAPPVAPPCPCSPPATLVELDSVTTYFPDSPLDLVENPPADPTYDPTPGASLNKVAMVLARVYGPQPGTCCKGPESLFRIKVNLSSAFKVLVTNPPSGPDYSYTVNKWHSGHALIRSCRSEEGMKIGAKTCGLDHDFMSVRNGQSAFPCPGNDELPDWGTEIEKIEITTSWDMPVSCSNATPWPCTVKDYDLLTEITFNGDDAPDPMVPGSGGIQIFWRVDFGSDQCKMDPVTGKIKREVFLRGDDVYSPDRHSAGWLHKKADPDGDGRNNHRELVDGTNPLVAD